MRAPYVALVIASALGFAMGGVSISRAQAPKGFEVGGNIAFIKAAAQAPYKIQQVGGPDVTTTIWDGHYVSGSFGASFGDSLSKHVADIEAAIRGCDESALASAKAHALKYLQAVLVHFAPSGAGDRAMDSSDPNAMRQPDLRWQLDGGSHKFRSTPRAYQR